MDATLAGLLQGCAEAPEDNAPHLILADWLEDHRQPERAELVRLQCKLADWVPDWQERQALIARQDQLIAAQRDTWLGTLPAHLCVEFVRGLCHIHLTGKVCASRAFREWLTAHKKTALVEQVRLYDCKAFKQIATRRCLEEIPALVLGLNTESADLVPLLLSPSTERLVSLDLSNSPFDAETLEIFLAAPLFPRLARLALRNSHLQASEITALLDAASPRLRDLDVAGNNLTPALIERLAHHRPPTRRMNSLGMEFVRIPEGSFLMGSVEDTPGAGIDQYPQHPVTLTKPFWLGRFAVTQQQYEAVVGANPANFSLGPRSLPVESVNYSDAEDFYHLLEQRTGETYRLPTEAEWEYACRAGTFTAYFRGEEHSLRWMNCHTGHPSEPRLSPPRRPMPVGTYPPNGFGLYEMHGNVWEWTSDFYADNYSRHGSVDPVGTGPGDRHPVRGGCWDAVPVCCRSAHRYGENVARRDRFTGFRIVLVTET
jgi:uncharacterized protein (TIGR02996 family)